MKQLWKNGNIKAMKGVESSRWKGGTSSLTQLLRADYNLYKFWKYPTLQKNQFKCEKCFSTKKLTIHHDKQKMHEIIELFIPEDKHELSHEEKKDIISKIVQYHVDNNVSGVTLCKDCHKKEHNSYNF